MYATTTNSRTYCTHLSLQGSTPGGGREQIRMSTSFTGSLANAPSRLCQQNALLLAGFLDTAGLH